MIFGAPETTPAATVLPRLLMVFACAFTSLEGCYAFRLEKLYVQEFPLGIVTLSFRQGFLGAEIRSSPLPFSFKRSRFGTVSAHAHRQAVSRLSWLSFSPSWICQERRALSLARSVTLTRPELPTPVTVERTIKARTPGMDFHQFEPSRPKAFQPRACPCRPTSIS